MVAERLGRDCIGIELSPDYIKMAEERLAESATRSAEEDD
jgi:DNA modification methylase